MSDFEEEVLAAVASLGEAVTDAQVCVRLRLHRNMDGERLSSALQYLLDKHLLRGERIRTIDGVHYMVRVSAAGRDLLRGEATPAAQVTMNQHVGVNYGVINQASATTVPDFPRRSLEEAFRGTPHVEDVRKIDEELKKPMPSPGMVFGALERLTQVAEITQGAEILRGWLQNPAVHQLLQNIAAHVGIA